MKNSGCVPPAPSSRHCCCCSPIQGTVAAGPESGLAERLEAIVRVHTEIPADARTAAYLGTERDGSGVVIDDTGLVVTIGYLITEAMGAEVTTGAGRVSRADVVGFEPPRGLACCAQPNPWQSSLCRSALRQTPRENAGRDRGLRRAGASATGGRRIAPSLCRLLGVPARGCDLHCPAPPCLEWCRRAGPDGKLAGIGSLVVSDAEPDLPGNMFVPIDRLRPVMGDLLALGDRQRPRVLGSASICENWMVGWSSAASRRTVRATKRGSAMAIG